METLDFYSRDFTEDEPRRSPIENCCTLQPKSDQNVQKWKKIVKGYVERGDTIRTSSKQKEEMIRFPKIHCFPDHLVREMYLIFFDEDVKRREKTDLLFSMPNTAVGIHRKLFLPPGVRLNFREQSSLETLRHVFCESYVRTLLEIMCKKTSVNLSILEWLCINYSKEYNVHYHLHSGSPIDFSIYNSYCTNLDLFGSGLFDPFARSHRIVLEIVDKDGEMTKTVLKEIVDHNSMENGTIYWSFKHNMGARALSDRYYIYLITSIGQLLFFNWAIPNKVVDYAKNYGPLIKQHMISKKEKSKTSKHRSPTSAEKNYRLRTSMSDRSLEDVVKRNISSTRRKRRKMIERQCESYLLKVNPFQVSFTSEGVDFCL